MKKFITVPREVIASQITHVHAAGSSASPGNMAELTLDDGAKFFAPGAMTGWHWPEPGDYLVSAPYLLSHPEPETITPEIFDDIRIVRQSAFVAQYQAVEGVEGITQGDEIVPVELPAKPEGAAA